MPTNRTPRKVDKRIRITADHVRLFKQAMEDQPGAKFALHVALGLKPWDFNVKWYTEPDPPPTITSEHRVRMWRETHKLYLELEALAEAD